MPVLLDKPKIITRYDYAAQAEVAPGVHFDAKKDKSLTNQADMDSADINKIMARYERTGVIVDPTGGERKPMWGDFTEVKSYHETLGAVRRTEQAFSLLPASVRNRFENDPQKLIDFLEDSKNDEEAIKMGLKEKKAPEPKEEAAAAPAAAAPATGGAAEAAKSGTMPTT